MAFTKRADVNRALTYAEMDDNFSAIETAHAEALEARDIAVSTTPIYVDTTAGLAATAEGGYFTVPDTATDELVIYREVAGAAVEQVRFGYRVPFNGGTISTALTMQSTDAGAGQVAGIILDRASASPAVNDYMVSIVFRGRTSAAAVFDFAAIRPMITNIGAGTEAVQLEILTALNGVVGYSAIFGAGVVLGAPTGGDLGRGTLNAPGLFVHGSAVLKQSEIFVSANQTITLAGPLTLAHGLGAAPRAVKLALVCQTAELGYSVGDVLMDVSSRTIASIVVDATNLNIRFLDSANATIVNKTTGVRAAFTAANWKARFFAFK